MNRLIVAILLSFGTTLNGVSQTPQVPSTIEFAGMKLHVNAGAQKQIQADVDALHRYEKYFLKKLDKVNLYFPIIEHVFREEKLPDDFKYLVIQESALIADAVSSSNAVGFWQFKKGTAIEVGLRIDREIDERLNIVSSSRAAAKYLKKNNMFFDNWIYALLAYNTGAGGARNYVDTKNYGKRHHEITKSTHWYVKKFLAHKVAFESEIHQDKDQPYFLYQYNKTRGKKLKEIAREFEVDQEVLESYNKCFKQGRVPDDKDFPVIIPIGYEKADLLAKKRDEVYEPVEAKKQESTSFFSFIDQQSNIKPFYSERSEFPRIKDTGEPEIFKINGKTGTVAKPGDNFEVMAIRGSIALKKFLRYNDLTEYDEPVSGQVYYFEKKNNKAQTHYHTLMPGETLWGISQKYGIKLKKLLSKNRLNDETEADPGLVLWLRFIRPRSVVPEYRNIQPLVAANNEEERKNVGNKSSDQQQKSIQTVPTSTEQTSGQERPASVSADTTSPDRKTKESSTMPPPDQQDGETDQDTPSIVQEKHKTPEIEYKKSITHTVAPGDTYFNIANRYNVDMVDLLEWNNRSVSDVLSIGQKLVVYGIDTQKDAPPTARHVDTTSIEDREMVVHTVLSDETLYGIARKYNVTIKNIMEWNEKEDFKIKSGEKLKIYPR